MLGSAPRHELHEPRDGRLASVVAHGFLGLNEWLVSTNGNACSSRIWSQMAQKRCRLGELSNPVSASPCGALSAGATGGNRARDTCELVIGCQQSLALARNRQIPSSSHWMFHTSGS